MSTNGNAVAEKRVDFTYNALGQFSTISRYSALTGGSGNEVATSIYGYDNAGRIASLSYTHDATTLAGYEWLYDAASRIIAMKSAADATTGNTWGVVDYTYDNTDQLQTATYATFANGPADEDYGYDANGNRNTNGNTVEATGDNRQATDSSGNAYTYDSEGNRLTRTDSTGAVTEYEWDYRNRLTKVTFKDNSAEHAVTKTVDYAYDVMNRLVKETVTVGAAVTQTVFVYDGIEAVLQFEKTGSGEVTAADLAHRYLWGSAVDQILASESPLPLGEGQGEGFDLTTPGTVLWSLTDHQGSVRDIVDNAGVLIDHRVYDSFGKPTSTPATDFLFGYTGKMYDSATNLQNNLNRWYDPSVGRWLSEDPIGFAGGDVNLSRYCGNDPVGKVDPRGTDWLDDYAGWFNKTVPGGSTWSGWAGKQIYDGLVGNNIIGNDTLAGAGAWKCFFYDLAVSIPLGIGIFVGGEIILGVGTFGGVEAGTGLITVSRWGRPGLEAGDFVMKGESTFWTYIRSCKWEPLWNEYAGPSIGESFLVPQESIVWPEGWQFFKGIFGQRIFVGGPVIPLSCAIADRSDISQSGLTSLIDGSVSDC